MATKKVIYFTAGAKPTSNELADIAKLNAAAQPAYDVQVWKSGTPQSTPVRATDYVGSDAAAIPAEYSAVTVIDPDDIPTAPLPDTQAIVLNAGTLSITNSAGADGHTATLTVAGSAVTAAKFAATVAVLDNADTVNVENSAGNLDSPGTVAVALGVVTNVRLASTKTIVTSGVDLTVPVTGVYATKATPTVVNGVITAIVLS